MDEPQRDRRFKWAFHKEAKKSDVPKLAVCYLNFLLALTLLMQKEVLLFIILCSLRGEGAST